jgi:ketosteroid isomerase-like protein
MLHTLGFYSFTLTAAFLLTSCSPTTTDDLNSYDLRYLQSIADRDGERVMGKQWDTLTAQYSLDAVRMPPNGPPVRGLDSIRQWFNSLPPIKSFHFNMDDLNGGGSYAYMRATYDITLAPPGDAEISDTGKTLIVFRKQPDGSWLRVVDSWSSNLPPGK